jgi:hypothetical protein
VLTVISLQMPLHDLNVLVGASRHVELMAAIQSVDGQTRK